MSDSQQVDLLFSYRVKDGGDEQAVRDHLRVTADGQRTWGGGTELLDMRVIGPVSEAFRTEFAIPASSHFARFRKVAR